MLKVSEKRNMKMHTNHQHSCADANGWFHSLKTIENDSPKNWPGGVGGSDFVGDLFGGIALQSEIWVHAYLLEMLGPAGYRPGPWLIWHLITIHQGVSKPFFGTSAGLSSYSKDSTFHGRNIQRGWFFYNKFPSHVSKKTPSMYFSSMKCTSKPAVALTTDRLISQCISTCRPSAKQVPRISMRVSELPTGLFQEAFDIRLVTKLCMRD